MAGRELLVGEVFRTGARSAPDRVAAATPDRALTFAEVDRLADRVAARLADRGVGRHDRVVGWHGTTLDAVPLFAALAKAGAVYAPANGLLTVDEAVEMVGLARPALLVVDADHATAGAEVADRLGVPWTTLDPLLGATGGDGGSDPDPVDLRESDPHVVFFTSGSTGRSKGVVLSHRVGVLRTHPGSQLEPRGATVCTYPLFHMGAWTIALQAWQAQAAVVFVPPDPALVVAAVARWGATHLNAIPGVWRRIEEHVAAHPGAADGLAGLRVVDSGTSATPPDLLEALRRLAPGAVRRVFYGSTEAGAVTLLRDEDMADRPGSCGRPQHSVRIRTDPGTGELQVAGPLLFDGYFDDPVATAEAFTADGWFRTGDVAHVDGDGFVTIVGRVRDVVRTGGETVAPAEVEAVLAGHPAFVDVAVVGLPDPVWGEVVCAVVVATPGVAVPDVEALRTWIGDRLARFKHPRRVEVVDAVPRTAATHQVQRRLLVEQIVGR